LKRCPKLLKKPATLSRFSQAIVNARMKAIATTKPVVAEVNIGKVIATIRLKFDSVVSPPYARQSVLVIKLIAG